MRADVVLHSLKIIFIGVFKKTAPDLYFVDKETGSVSSMSLWGLSFDLQSSPFSERSTFGVAMEPKGTERPPSRNCKNLLKCKAELGTLPLGQRGRCRGHSD